MFRLFEKKLSLQKIISFSSSSNSLANFNIQYGKTHLIAIGGMASVNSILELVKTRPEMKEKTTIISSKSWLSKIHHDWYYMPWGQSMRYLPKEYSKMARELFPNYPQEELMTFGMMKEIEEELRKKVKNSGVRLVEDNVTEILGKESQVVINLESGKTEIINTGNDYHVLHTGRTPISLPGISANNFGNAYSFSKHESNTPIVIVGSGLNATWACRDFKSRPIINLLSRDNGDKLQHPGKESGYQPIYLEDSVITQKDGKIHISGKNINTNEKIEEIVDASQLYSAMGFELDHKLVNVDDFSKISLLDTSPNARDISTYYSFNNEIIKKTQDLRGTKVPNGNLLLNSLKIKFLFGLYSPIERHAVLLTDHWRDEVLKKAQDSGIIIDEEFFERITDLVKHAYTDYVPEESQIWQVIKIAYNKKTNTGVDRNGNTITWDDFVKLISAPTKNINNNPMP